MNQKKPKQNMANWVKLESANERLAGGIEEKEREEEG